MNDCWKNKQISKETKTLKRKMKENKKIKFHRILKNIFCNNSKMFFCASYIYFFLPHTCLCLLHPSEFPLLPSDLISIPYLTSNQLFYSILYLLLPVSHFWSPTPTLWTSDGQGNRHKPYLFIRSENILKTTESGTKQGVWISKGNRNACAQEDTF